MICSLTYRWPSVLRSLPSRLVYFWLVWSGLIAVHEMGHAQAARSRGEEIRSVAVGAGPTLWSGDIRGIETSLRLVPLVGQTTYHPRVIQQGNAVSAGPATSRASRELWILAAGVAATVALAIALSLFALLIEHFTRRRMTLARYVLADAIVLSIVNLLPVPPLDGGRAMLVGISSLYGASVQGDTLFWVHVAGVALAIIPLAIWTRWTEPIDALALRIGAPRDTARARGSNIREIAAR